MTGRKSIENIRRKVVAAMGLCDPIEQGDVLDELQSALNHLNVAFNYVKAERPR